MSAYARRTASQAGHETAQTARKAATRQRQTDDPTALLATSSAQAAMQARLAALAQGSGRAAQLRALQASADTRPLPEGMAAVQRFDGGEEEELPVQGRFADTAQRNGVEEEEPLQGRFTDTVQRSGPEEEEPLQGRFSAAPAQRQATGEESPAQMAKAPAPPNRSGLPDQLKAGIEALSGMSMDNVRVHYNSAKPAQLNALAYAQGTDIHMGPGQEQHLPHEAWHVVQQAQGRVRPTMQMQGTAVNDDVGLEKEADVMGAKAVIQQRKQASPRPGEHLPSGPQNPIAQRISEEDANQAQFTFSRRATEHGYTQEQLRTIMQHRFDEITVGTKQSMLLGGGTETGYGVHGQILYNCTQVQDVHRIFVFHAHGHGHMG